MDEPLAPWSNYYVITGSSAAALTGLMFVVVSLVSSARAGTSREGFTAYSTPTIVHFCAALLISVIAAVPWRSEWPACTLWGLTGLAGLMYELRIVYGIMRRFTAYQPDAEDWTWYAGLPLVGYLALAVTPLVFSIAAPPALYIPAATAIAMIFIGIHNAWDVVTYLTLESSDTSDKNQ